MSGSYFYPVPPPAMPVTGDFAGVAPATLQTWLLEAQLALQKLMTGTKEASLSYSQGDGSRSVSYTMATVAGLRAHIAALQAALGVFGSGRRPIRPFFL